MAHPFDSHTEHTHPLDPILVAGVHGTQGELDFVRGVITGVIRGQAGYGGPIELVGSRAKGWWLSPYKFTLVCQELPVDEQMKWLKFLNTKAKQSNYSRIQLPLLVDYLPKTAPSILEILLEQEDPGSDFDILLKTTIRPSGVSVAYHDIPNDQVLDVYIQGEM